MGTDDHSDQAAARAGETSVPHLSRLSPAKYSPLPSPPLDFSLLQPPGLAVPGHHVLFQDPGLATQRPCRHTGHAGIGGTRAGCCLDPRAATGEEGPEARGVGTESPSVGPQGRGPFAE